MMTVSSFFLSLQDVLAEIPSQVVQYFERRGIRPGVADVNEVQRRLRSFAFKDA